VPLAGDELYMCCTAGCWMIYELMVNFCFTILVDVLND
jgi:hypothetical protein